MIVCLFPLVQVPTPTLASDHDRCPRSVRFGAWVFCAPLLRPSVTPPPQHPVSFYAQCPWRLAALALPALWRSTALMLGALWCCAARTLTYFSFLVRSDAWPVPDQSSRCCPAKSGARTVPGSSTLANLTLGLSNARPFLAFALSALQRPVLVLLGLSLRRSDAPALL